MRSERSHLCCCIGHNVEESGCNIYQGRYLGFLLGSTHLGLCNKDFPEHRTKPCDVTMTMRLRGISFGPLEQDSHRASEHPRLFSFTWKIIHRICPSCGLTECEKSTLVLTETNLILPVSSPFKPTTKPKIGLLELGSSQQAQLWNNLSRLVSGSVLVVVSAMFWCVSIHPAEQTFGATFH